MSTTTSLLKTALPELAYGSVWLVGSGEGGPDHLSPLAMHVLGGADVVILDPAIPQKVLDLVKPPRYREAAAPGRAIERSIKLAQDGWRVVHVVTGDGMERAIDCATSFAEENIPFHIAPTADEPLIGEAPIGLLLVRKPLKVGCTETGTLVVLMAAPQSEASMIAERRQPPLGFSMSGLAG